MTTMLLSKLRLPSVSRLLTLEKKINNPGNDLEKPFSKNTPQIFASSTAKESRRRQARDARERAIFDNLARYALIPASENFSLNPNWSPFGLSEEAARAARERHGLNKSLAEQPLRPFSVLFAATVNPFNMLITILAGISIGTGQMATFVIMVIMIVLSTGLRFWQEMKSLSKAAALVNSVTTRVRVLRPQQVDSTLPSTEVEIDRKHVVPGDVLSVASGDVFPGDCVLLTSSSLFVSQASLTGELMPVEKFPRLSRPPPEYVFNILDSENICLAGTAVNTGSGTALVLSTGLGTYMASIAKELASSRPVNAVQVGVRRVSMVLLVFMLVMAPIVLVIQGCVSRDWKGALLFAIAVAVGITPEMLPMIVASNLALSAIRVARKKVIVKRFDAIQNLGAMSILCSDKTGTLTVDSVCVTASTTDAGIASDLPTKLAYLNSVMQTGTRSPIDSAIVDHVKSKQNDGMFGDISLNDWLKLGELPFESCRRLLSILVCKVSEKDDNESRDALFITKGAVEEVLNSCTRVYDYSTPPSVPESPSLGSPSLAEFDPELPLPSSLLTADKRRSIFDTAERLNEDGLRLVAVACKLFATKPSTEALVPIFPEDEEDLTFIGFLGFLDPPKAGATNAIAKLNKLNVQVRILTGDSPTVAAKVARDLGILGPRKTTTIDTAITEEPDKIVSLSPVGRPSDVCIEMEPVSEKDLIVTGSQLSALSNAEDKKALREVVERGIIFAKLSPHQKLEVVEILRKGGSSGERAVAFLGDGVNDALAIRGADVGISVESGTEVAKEAADVILLEKDLDVVAEGVLQGRITFINTIKYVKLAASSNFGNVFSLLVASAWLPYQPMLPIQLLTQNLLYDFSQGSIPWDNVDPEFLEMPKNWNVKSVITFMLCIGPLSSPFDICTFCINWFKYGIRSLDSPLIPRARAHWFIEGSITQLFIIHFLRTPKLPFIQSRASLSVTLITTAVAAISLVIPWIPGVNTALKFEPPAPEFYAFTLAITIVYAALVHIGKTIYIRIFKSWL